MEETPISDEKLDTLIALVSEALDDCDRDGLAMPAIDLNSALEKLKAVRR